MSLLIYLATRGIMALAALMAVDALADTVLAAEATHIVAATTLIVIAEAIIEVNTKS